MSRIHFETSESFSTWLQDRDPGKYELYRLPGRTIAVPTVSTRPVLYGVYDNRISDDEVHELKEQGYGPFYDVSAYRFKTEEAERKDV